MLTVESNTPWFCRVITRTLTTAAEISPQSPLAVSQKTNGVKVLESTGKPRGSRPGEFFILGCRTPAASDRANNGVIWTP